MLGWLSHLLFPASTVLGSPPWVGSRSSPRVACDGPIRMCHQEGAAGGAQPQRAKRCPSCSALGGLHHAGSCSPCPRISCIHNPHPLQPRCMKRASKVINGYQHVSCASQTFSSGVMLQGSLLAFQTASFLPVSWQKKSFAAHSPKLHLTWNTRSSWWINTCIFLTCSVSHKCSYQHGQHHQTPCHFTDLICLLKIQGNLIINS